LFFIITTSQSLRWSFCFDRLLHRQLELLTLRRRQFAEDTALFGRLDQLVSRLPDMHRRPDRWAKSSLKGTGVVAHLSGLVSLRREPELLTLFRRQFTEDAAVFGVRNQLISSLLQSINKDAGSRGVCHHDPACKT
jgi:hypothetical protein